MAENVTPVLVHVDKWEKEKLNLALEEAKQKLQLIIDSYNSVTLVIDGEAERLSKLTETDFITLFTDTSSILYTKITKGAPLVIGGLALDAEKAMEIIKTPEGFDELIQLIRSINQRIPDVPGNAYTNPATLVKYFTVNNDGTTVIFTAVATKALENSGKKYLSTSKSIAMYEFAQATVALFKEKGLNKNFSLDNSLAGIITVLKDSVDSVDWETGTIIPRHSYLRGV